MTMIVRMSSLSILAIALVAPARADEQADARKIIDKAITAHGGAEALSKYPAVTTKMKGRWFGMGEGIDYTGSFSIQGTDRYHFELTMTIANQQLTMIQA